MEYRPDYSDKNFIGTRSIFASILYFILACFNYFLSLAYFTVIDFIVFGMSFEDRQVKGIASAPKLN